MTMNKRDRLGEHWTETRASEAEVHGEVAAATGKPVPPGAVGGDALAHLTDDEVSRVHEAVCGKCETCR
jgi:hypothetical protein